VLDDEPIIGETPVQAGGGERLPIGGGAALDLPVEDAVPAEDEARGVPE
jgi:hypothetical protein